MNYLKIDNIIKSNNRIDYDYSFNGIWHDYLNKDYKMFIEYDFDVNKIPDSVLVIPFLCNILPIAWLFDLKIIVPILDEDFYDAIPNIKSGYQKMFPNLHFNGEVIVNKTEKNKFNAKKACCLFSGGVDATNTLINHINEKPIISTIWGSDINENNFDAWRIVENHHREVAKIFDIDFSYIRSNFRNCIIYKNIMRDLLKFSKFEWWHDFQHGIAILGHMAPFAYYYRIKTIYIASSFTQEDWGTYTCASDPIIDNNVKFSNCKVSHDGYDMDRVAKLNNISNFRKRTNIPIKLRVCWQSKNGDNCCICEKCCRTILGIISLKEDPNNYGFNLDASKMKILSKKYKFYIKYPIYGSNIPNYKGIIEMFKKNYSKRNIPREFKNIIYIKQYSKTPFHVSICHYFYKAIKKVLSIFKR